MADGETLKGQQFNPTDPAVIPYTVTIMERATADALQGQANTEITPINDYMSEVKVFGLAAVQALLDAEVVAMGAYANLSGELPNELTSVAVDYNLATGDGVSLHPFSQADVIIVGSGSGSVSPRASASGSASIMYDLQPVIKQFWAPRVPAVRYYFFMPESATLVANILTRLGTITGGSVLVFPTFKPTAAAITLKGQNVSVQVDADTNLSLSRSTSSATVAFDWGNGFKEDVGTSMKTVVLPPTLHGAISFVDASRPSIAGCAVEADASITLAAGTNHAGKVITNHIGPRAKLATAGISPTSLAATSPTAVPTSGKYLVDFSIEPYAFDRVRVFAEVVDFSYFA